MSSRCATPSKSARWRRSSASCTRIRGARASFLAQAEAEPQDAALLAEINADGQVTIDEFRGLSDVRNAVHNHGGGIVTFFEQQVVEAMRTE